MSFMNPNMCLVLGMSHIEAIRRGIPVDEKHKADVIGLNDSPGIFDQKKDVLNLDSLDPSLYEAIFLSIGGNFHNILGLIENPIPFTMHGKTVVSDHRARTLIPREMMLDHFRLRLKNLIELLIPIREHFPESNIYHISSPPPCDSDEHVMKNPGVFRNRVNQGISPKSLRLNLYDIQNELYAEKCSQLEISVISPPAATVTKNGFLKDQFLNNDPTHGNEKYGLLVWSQIKDILCDK